MLCSLNRIAGGSPIRDFMGIYYDIYDESFSVKGGKIFPLTEFDKFQFQL